MAGPIITTASFCSGVGWLDEGVRAGLEWLGFDHRAALLCEWEAYAASVLLARMEDESLEPCPVWCGDLADLDGRSFRGLVDIAIAGLPCQPYSSAGKQRGLDDQRSYGDGSGPIPNFLRIVAECQPAVVFLENVPPWVRGGWFRPVGEELCRMGYVVLEPLFVTAQSVGASHKRERVFILAHSLRTVGTERPGWQRIFDRGSALAESDGESGDVHGGQRARIFDPRWRGPELGDSRGATSERNARSVSGTEAEGGRERINDGDLPVGPEPTNAAVGHTSSARKVRRPARSRSRDSVGKPSGPVAQPASGGQPELRQSSERDGQSNGSNEQLGQSRGAGLEIRLSSPSGQTAQGTIERSSGGAALADTQSAERWREDSRRREIGRNAFGGAGTGVFAPGPQCEHWGAIISDWPELAPAIEPSLRVLVDGVAYVVDESRADQLRCAGNGCVALQAAVAFVELVRRLR